MNSPITTENGPETENMKILDVEELPADKDLLPEKRRATAPPDPVCIALAQAGAATFHNIQTSINPERERKRLEALKGIFGLWADREDIPKDGVEYQRQLRAEWE